MSLRLLVLLTVCRIGFSALIADWQTCNPGVDTCASASNVCCIAAADVSTGKHTCRPASGGGCVGPVYSDWSTCSLTSGYCISNSRVCCVAPADVPINKRTCRPKNDCAAPSPLVPPIRAPSPKPVGSPASPVIRPTAPIAINPSFVTRSGTDFRLNGARFVPVGFNAYWLGCCGMNTPNQYPTNAQIDELFTVANLLEATVVRSHTLGFSSGRDSNLRPTSLNMGISSRNSVNILNNAAWAPIDYSFAVARQKGIKLMTPLTDNYFYSNGNYGDFCDTRGVPKSAFFTNPAVRADFKDYIRQWLNHVNSITNIAIKDDPTLAFIELGNELGNIRPELSDTIPTREWLTDIASFIRTIDNKHLILGPSDECLGGPISQDFSVAGIDVYSAHFYYEDGRLASGALSAAGVGKPFIIGEYTTSLQSWVDQQATTNPNIKGSFFWQVFSHNQGLAGTTIFNAGSGFPSSDEYTLHFPEDLSKLLSASNHFRRMRGLPTVSQLCYNGQCSSGGGSGGGGTVPDWQTCNPGVDTCASASNVCCIAAADVSTGKHTCRPASGGGCVGPVYSDWSTCSLTSGYCISNSRVCCVAPADVPINKRTCRPKNDCA